MGTECGLRWEFYYYLSFMFCRSLRVDTICAVQVFTFCFVRKSTTSYFDVLPNTTDCIVCKCEKTPQADRMCRVIVRGRCRCSGPVVKMVCFVTAEVCG